MSSQRRSPPRRSPPRRLSTSPETDSPDLAARRSRRQSSKEDVLSALGGRRPGSLDVSVPLPPSPATTARSPGQAWAPKPMRRPPQRPVSAILEPEPEPEGVIDDNVEPWLREAQLLEAAIGALLLFTPLAVQREANKAAAPQVDLTPARRLSDGTTSNTPDEVCVTFTEHGPLGLNLTSSDDGCGTMILAVQQDTQAVQHPELIPGLVLGAVGLTLVAGRTHEAVTGAIQRHTERPLTLRFMRPNPNSSAAPPPIAKALPPPPISLGGGGGDSFDSGGGGGGRGGARTPPRVRPGSPVSREELAKQSARELLEEYGGGGSRGSGRFG